MKPTDTPIYDDLRHERRIQNTRESWKQIGVGMRQIGEIFAAMGEGMRAGVDAAAPAGVIDAAHIAHQREWSEATFGPGSRQAGVIDHIRKELVEIEDAQDPDAILSEWVDVIILGLDGAWRCGAEPQAIIDAVKAKQRRNEGRIWPDWRTADRDAAIEHVRSEDERR